MANSPSIYKDRVLAWNTYCNGTKLDSSYELISASIRMELNRIGKATLKFNAGNMDRQKFEETDSDFFKPGNTIRFDAGSLNSQDTLFEGIIIQTGIRVGRGFRSQMVVECRDNAYPATQGRKNRIFEKKKDDEIIKEVLSEYGTVKVDDTTYQHPEMVQYYATDWDFALSRADACGLFALTRGSDISFFKPEVDASPVLTVTYGVDLISFDGGLSGVDQYTKYEGVSWNPAEQNTVKVAASAPALNKQGDLQPGAIAAADSLLIQTDAPAEEGALKEWVDSLALKAGLARYQGKMKFYGAPEAVPGCLIELKGLGKRFNGNVFVGSVGHIIEKNEWVTEIGIGINPSSVTDEPDIVAPSASGFLPGLEGLHTGVVKQLQDDPSDGYRIQVELPWMDGTKKELWARFSTMYATGSSGCFFLPETGDEVLVGFINHNPSCPVVLGSIYGGMHQPPFEYEAENNTKAIVSRSELTIEFDEEKKIMTLHTPAENSIEISDDGKSIKLSDQNKNEIVMDESGILLSSAKDIKLQAKGNISLDATAKVEITAKSDVAIDGANVKATAKIGFSAKGNATAELSASGQTTVKGAMVMIN